MGSNQPVIKKMRDTIPTTLQYDETFDIGSDTITSVCDRDYTSPFEFTGKIKRFTLQLKDADE